MTRRPRPAVLRLRRRLLLGALPLAAGLQAALAAGVDGGVERGAGAAGAAGGALRVRSPQAEIDPDAPAAQAGDAAPVQRVALTSCMRQDLPQPVWGAVQGAAPDLLVCMGDNVYASSPLFQAWALRAAYRRQAQVPGYAALRRSVRTLAIWDDNDYGQNDGGAGFAGKQASKEAFLAHWQVPAADPRRRRPGLHAAWRFGPPGQRLQVIVLDGRWFRSDLQPSSQPGAPGRERYQPSSDPARTMLGEAQWQWLEAQLRQPADLRLLVSGVQVLAEGHGWECWANLPLQRRRLFDLIGRTGARGVVLASGDRHFGAFYRSTAGTPYALTEITSSGISHPWAEANEPGPNRLGPQITVPHAGWLQVDWAAQRVQLALHDSAGTVQQQHTLALADLRPA